MNISQADEIHRKIGRNIMELQKAEGLLKFIVKFQSIGSHASGFTEHLEKIQETVSKMTMGGVVTKYLDRNDKRDEPNVSSELFLSFEMVSSQKYINEKTIALQKLVEERNHLVHHFFESYDLYSHESCKEADNFLDQQFEHIKKEIISLQKVTRGIVDLVEAIQKDPNVILTAP